MAKQHESSNRVIARLLATELTPEEVNAVAGGGMTRPVKGGPEVAGDTNYK